MLCHLLDDLLNILGTRPSKRQKQKSVADDLICPITLDLPYDPVTAADGRIYERLAIEAHINNNSNRILKSPMTNESMGRALLPSPQTKSQFDYDSYRNRSNYR